VNRLTGVGTQGRERRWTTWLIGGATAFSLLGDQTLYSTLPIFFEDLGLRPVEVGVILSANRWVRLGTNELAHRLTNRNRDLRGLFVAAVTLGAMTTAAYATTPGFVLFVAARLVWGLCWSFIRHLGVLSVMTVEGGQRAGRAAGRLGGIGRIGSVGGLLGGALLVDWLGFSSALLVLAVVSAAAIPLAGIGFAPIAQPSATVEAGVGEAGPVLASALGFAHGMVGPGLVMATLGAVLDERVSGNGPLSAAALTGGVLAVRFLLESTTAARLGAISDSRGIRFAASGAFALGTVSLVVAATSPPVIVLIAAVVAFFVSGTALGAALVGFAGRQGSRALARYATASDLGAATGPLIGWIALGLFETRSLGLGIGAVIYGLAAALAFRFLSPQLRPH